MRVHCISFYNTTIAMATADENTADDSTVSFDLSIFFDRNQEEIAELNEQDIPDGDLLTLMDAVSENFSVPVKKDDLPKQQADNTVMQKPKKKQHFPDITMK